MSLPKHLALILLIVLTGPFFYGCQPHLVNLRPEPLAEGPGAFSEPAPAKMAGYTEWWAPFEDGNLDGLIRQALAGNFDVMRALARLEQAAALTRQARAERLPLVDLVASRQEEWLDGEQEKPLMRIEGALSWEIDMFNRLGAAAMARQSEQAALLETVETVRLSLSAAVAEAYFDAVEQRRQLVLLRRQIDVDRDLLNLTQLRFKAGLTASVDVLQQSSQLADTESLIPPAQAALRVAENRLDVLSGAAPDALNRLTDENRFTAMDTLPFIGVPSDLLLNRPDLRALKNDLIAADARIGQAIADRLPRIILDGSLAYEEGPEFTGTSVGILGSLVQPLLDWGSRKAEVARNKAVYQERLAAFSQAYLAAIEAVENALYQERKQREFLDRLERRRQFLSLTVDETRDRYTNGLTDFLPVLDAITEFQRLERVIVRQQRILLGFRIRLHRSLGGPVGASAKEG